jgi:hypothetical protein
LRPVAEPSISQILQEAVFRRLTAPAFHPQKRLGEIYIIYRYLQADLWVKRLWIEAGLGRFNQYAYGRLLTWGTISAIS